MSDTYIYFLRDDERRVKIGRSRLPLARLGEIVRSNGHAIELMGVIPGGKALELALHGSFAYLRIPPDPSLGDGRTEWFTLDYALSAYIATNALALPDGVSRKSRPSPYGYDYRPVLSIAARDALTALAESLGFIVAREGMYHNTPSVTDMLESLAEAYRADSDEVETALRAIGVVKPAEDGT